MRGVSSNAGVLKREGAQVQAKWWWWCMVIILAEGALVEWTEVELALAHADARVISGGHT